MDELVDSQRKKLFQIIIGRLNANADCRATSGELIGNNTAPIPQFREALAYLIQKGYLRGPVYTEEYISGGGDNSFRMSISLTLKGQAYFVQLIREEYQS